MVREQSPGHTVLVVDDEPMVRRLLDLVLSQAGFAVRQAADGPEAVELYRENLGEIVLVLLDVCLGAWDGPRTLAALRELDPAVPCCFMSGNTGPYTVEGLLALGAAGFFPKPLRLDQVTEAVGRLASRNA